MTPTFLTLEEVAEIHRDQIARHGGSPGIRDLGLLKSALAQPASSFDGQYLHVDLSEMAADVALPERAQQCYPNEETQHGQSQASQNRRDIAPSNTEQRGGESPGESRK